jgi:hypothetical protein
MKLGRDLKTGELSPYNKAEVSVNHQSNWEEQHELAANLPANTEVFTVDAVASLLESAREEGGREERREILDWAKKEHAIHEQLSQEIVGNNDWHTGQMEFATRMAERLTSRESSEGGKCCQKCEQVIPTDSHPDSMF